MNEPAITSDGAAPSTRRILRLLGGFRLTGGSPVPRRLLVITAVGGLDADLTRAILPTEAEVPEVELTKISLVGGVDLVVPPGTVVDTDGVTLIGHMSAGTAPAPGEPIRLRVRVRSFGVLGGVKVSTR